MKKFHQTKANRRLQLKELADQLRSLPGVVRVSLVSKPIPVHGPKGAMEYKPHLEVEVKIDPGSRSPLVPAGLREQGAATRVFCIELRHDDCSDSVAEKRDAGMGAWYVHTGKPVHIVTDHDWAVHAHRFQP